MTSNRATTTPDDPAKEAPGGMPHERDESVDREAEHQGPDRGKLEQAHRDVESSIEDTERIGTPTDLPSSSSR